jgi:hypothetical protein
MPKIKNRVEKRIHKALNKAERYNLPPFGFENNLVADMSQDFLWRLIWVNVFLVMREQLEEDAWK